MKQNEAHIVLEKHLRELGFEFEREYLFAANRKWRFDFLAYRRSLTNTDSQVAIEIEGGVWSRGRHLRPQGFLRDAEKYNTATMLGYRVLRFSTQEVLTGKAKEFLERWSKS